MVAMHSALQVTRLLLGNDGIDADGWVVISDGSWWDDGTARIISIMNLAN